MSLDQVRKLTSLLRSGDEPFSARLRNLLRERGCPWREGALAECFPDDDSFEFGVVVTVTGRSFSSIRVTWMRRSEARALFQPTM
jgi:hypothetical protein